MLKEICEEISGGITEWVSDGISKCIPEEVYEKISIRNPVQKNPFETKWRIPREIPERKFFLKIFIEEHLKWNSNANILNAV